MEFENEWDLAAAVSNRLYNMVLNMSTLAVTARSFAEPPADLEALHDHLHACWEAWNAYCDQIEPPREWDDDDDNIGLVEE